MNKSENMRGISPIIRLRPRLRPLACEQAPGLEGLIYRSASVPRCRRLAPTDKLAPLSRDPVRRLLSRPPNENTHCCSK